MTKQGFPSFGITQSGAYISALKNYNLPDFILALVAKDCNSDYSSVEELMIDYLV